MTPVCLVALAVASRFRRAYEYAVCVPAVIMSAVLSVMILKTHGDYRTSWLGLIRSLLCGRAARADARCGRVADPVRAPRAQKGLASGAAGRA